MTAYFFDSSALVKRYARETGTAWIISLFRPAVNRIYVAHITVVEVVSALSRRVRSGSLTADDASRAIGRFRRSFNGKFLKVAITATVINHAVALAEQHCLRGYDAIQLAAAIEIHTQRLNAGAAPVVLVSADAALNAVAAAPGLLVDDPNFHP